MRLLLTSAGVANPSIHEALVGLVGRPLAEARALCVPTASYGHPMSGPEQAWRFVSGTSPLRMSDLGWASVGLLELTALPSLDAERWVRQVREADVLLVGGGDAAYLAHWMRASGVADLLPQLQDTVWVGLSAGSMVLTPRVGHDFVQWRRPGAEPSPEDDVTLGVVDFSIFPHLRDAPDSENTTVDAGRWAAELGLPAYAIDDQTAIRVVDGEVDVVSEGRWLPLG